MTQYLLNYCAIVNDSWPTSMIAAIRSSCYTNRGTSHICSVLFILGLFTLLGAANENTDIPQYQWMVKLFHSQSYVCKPYAMTLCLRNVS